MIHWPTSYWPEDYWPQAYWGTEVTYWPDQYWSEGYWIHQYWPGYYFEPVIVPRPHIFMEEADLCPVRTSYLDRRSSPALSRSFTSSPKSVGQGLPQPRRVRYPDIEA